MKISLPKIGIRPVIDGRRMGVRESLEAQTSEHGESHRRAYQRETAVCSLAACDVDTRIAGMAESAACEEKFSSQNVGVNIHRHPLLVLRQLNHRHGSAAPEGHLGFNGTERPGRSICRCWRPIARRDPGVLHLRT
ncbi:hypothetical protein MJ584_21920 [Klebsiella pneumoniae]|nr:hypothetical protein MJ584_21920 [Klebsiella pneumoniae]